MCEIILKFLRRIWKLNFSKGQKIFILVAQISQFRRFVVFLIRSLRIKRQWTPSQPTIKRYNKVPFDLLLEITTFIVGVFDGVTAVRTSEFSISHDLVKICMLIKPISHDQCSRAIFVFSAVMGKTFKVICRFPIRKLTILAQVFYQISRLQAATKLLL